MNYDACVITVSDGCSDGEREDLSGPAAVGLLESAGFTMSSTRIVPDDEPTIVATLQDFVRSGVGLIVTTGGTGFAPRDVTPEATRRVIQREAPGLSELMRATGITNTPRAALSRGVCGICESTLIINLPGSVKGVKESLEAVLPLLMHACALIQDAPVDHTPVPSTTPAPAKDPTLSRVVVMEANIDDLSPEQYELALERLLEGGALDVCLAPIQMKKNRPAQMLTVIVPPGKLEDIAQLIFANTSTFGIRYTSMDRITLQRDWITVDTAFGQIRIKTGSRNNIQISAAPEYEDAKEAARRTGAPLKEIYAAAMAAYKSLPTG